MAPKAFLVPISLVRSEMDTNIMFITPIPPTKSEIPAIIVIANDTEDITFENSETRDSIVKVLTSKFRFFR